MYKSHYSVATSTNTIAAVESLLARKIDNATAGLRPFLTKALCRLWEANAGTITSLGYEYKHGQKFASDIRKDISDPHPAILELASLFNIAGPDIAEIGDLNDKVQAFEIFRDV